MNEEMELLLSEKEMKFGDKRVIIKRISLLDGMRLTQQISSVASMAIEQSGVVSNALMKIAFSGGERLDDNGKPVTDDSGNVLKFSEQEVNGIKISGVLEIFNVLGEDIVDLVKELIVKATNLSDEEAEEIDCVDGVDLIAEIIEVNKPFFQKLSSKLKEKMAKKPAKEKAEKSKKK